MFYTTSGPILTDLLKCGGEAPKVSMQKNGTMVTVRQCCENCGPNAFMWRFQPLVLRRYPAGNILLRFAILMAGASVNKVLLVLKHLGFSIYCARTYFALRSKFLFPAILTHCERYRTNLVNELKRKGGHLVWWWEIWLYGTLQNMVHTKCSAAQLLKLHILNLSRYVINIQVM